MEKATVATIGCSSKNLEAQSRMELLSLPSELIERCFLHTLHALVADDPAVGKAEAAQVQERMDRDVEHGSFALPRVFDMQLPFDAVEHSMLSSTGQCLVSRMHRLSTVESIVKDWLPPAAVCKEVERIRCRAVPLLAEASCGVFPAHSSEIYFVDHAILLSFGRLAPIRPMPDQLRQIDTREQMRAEVAYRRSEELSAFWEAHGALQRYVKGAVSRARRAGDPHPRHVQRPAFRARLTAFAQAHVGIRHGERHWARKKLDWWVRDALQELLP